MTLNYANIDFNSLVEQLTSKLKQKDSWKDITESSTSATLIELFSYTNNLLMFYLQRTFEEHFVDTAQYWESLVRLAKLVNYKVRRPKGACGLVRITPRMSLKNNVEVTKGTRIYSNNNMVFYVAESVIFQKEDSYLDIKVRQGVKRTKIFSGTGKSFQKFIFGTEKTTDIDLVVEVNNNLLIQVDSIIASSINNCYELVTEIDGGLSLNFGTPFVGGVPALNSSIKVTYYDVEGLLSNIYSDDNWSTELNDFIVTQISPLVGGDDMETVEELRRNIPAIFSTGARCISKDDFKSIVEAHPGVDKVYVRDVKDNLDIPFKSISIYIKPVDGYILSEVLKEDITKIIKKRYIIGTDFSINSPLLREVQVLLRIKIKEGFSKNELVQKCNEQINKLYANLDFGEWVHLSLINSTIKVLNGVHSVSIILPTDDVFMNPWEFAVLKSVKIEVL